MNDDDVGKFSLTQSKQRPNTETRTLEDKTGSLVVELVHALLVGMTLFTELFGSASVAGLVSLVGIIETWRGSFEQASEREDMISNSLALGGGANRAFCIPPTYIETSDRLREWLDSSDR